MANQWRHIGEKPPPLDQFVLVARESGYVCTDWELMTARLTERGWLDVGGDHLTESGSEPLYWQPEIEKPGCAGCMNAIGKHCEAADGQLIPDHVFKIGCEHFLGDIPF